MFGVPNPLLARSAQFEADRRAAAFIKRGQVNDDLANLEYQVWLAIADYFATGKSALVGSWGGIAEPPEHVITWALLADRAARAKEALDVLLAREQAKPASDALAALQQRHEDVTVIARILGKQKASMDALTLQTQEARARWRAEGSAAA